VALLFICIHKYLFAVIWLLPKGLPECVLGSRLAGEPFF
jgi:hypothetical protein